MLIEALLTAMTPLATMEFTERFLRAQKDAHIRGIELRTKLINCQETRQTYSNTTLNKNSQGLNHLI